MTYSLSVSVSVCVSLSLSLSLSLSSSFNLHLFIFSFVFCRLVQRQWRRSTKSFRRRIGMSALTLPQMNICWQETLVDDKYLLTRNVGWWKTTVKKKHLPTEKTCWRGPHSVQHFQALAECIWLQNHLFPVNVQQKILESDITKQLQLSQLPQAEETWCCGSLCLGRLQQ